MQNNNNAKTKVPNCIGVIVDGNRRWARAKGLPILEGHRAGYEKLKEFIRWARDASVTHVIAYVFSSENWNRSPEEISYLMKLLKRACDLEIEEFKKENARIRVIGERARLPKDVREAVEHAEKATKDCIDQTLVLAISYGGRDEIVQAVNSLIAARHQAPVSADEFSQCLWTHDIPDPDLIIRTSGEKRLSNFLTWQSVYSELFFIDTLWPDFTKEEFSKILEEYQSRERRFGK